MPVLSHTIVGRRVTQNLCSFYKQTVLKKTGAQGGAAGGSDGSSKGAPSSELLAIMQRRRMRSEEVAVAKAEPTVESQPENHGVDQSGRGGGSDSRRFQFLK